MPATKTARRDSLWTGSGLLSSRLEEEDDEEEETDIAFAYL